ncbi:response regulator transcription factor [Thermaerobacter subterraneus]|uniref:Stage 0 sporulation protein A homolog n=1 Tax=Thermaerobacter subterraneus DSM 13965 TaxID=867903 RepID=K6PZ46_9FIRM|nr:response regulator transcription factor [Thermaerobacter subterraneus]EKP94013.1 response regulator containing a CheY-like receiver domain and an HTH DNA-binding domain [Thermaerobacter subterraneus DSM 13965]
MLKILVATGRPLVREGLQRILEGAPGLQVVGHAAGPEPLLDRVRELVPDVVLLDLSLAAGDARELVGRIGRMPGSPVVVGITDRADPHALLGLVQAGLGGYLLANREAAGLSEAIRACTAGIFVIDAEIMSELASDSPLYRYVPAPEEVERARLLSQRELEVLSRIARGKTTAQVARELFISPKTVRNHLSHIMQKLGVRDRTQAVLFALRVGLIRRHDLLG